MNNTNILEQLSDLTGESAYYLRALNFQEAIQLDHYRKLFQNNNQLNQITNLLEAKSWREELIAYMIIMANPSINLLPELKLCFSQGSFISPQLAVAIALKAKKEGLNYFLNMFDSPQISSKSMGAIMAILPFCCGFELSLSKINIDLEEFRIGFLTATHHLSFWKENGWDYTEIK